MPTPQERVRVSAARPGGGQTTRPPSHLLGACSCPQLCSGSLPKFPVNDKWLASVRGTSYLPRDGGSAPPTLLKFLPRSRAKTPSGRRDWDFILPGYVTSRKLLSLSVPQFPPSAAGRRSLGHRAVRTAWPAEGGRRCWLLSPPPSSCPRPLALPGPALTAGSQVPRLRPEEDSGSAVTFAHASLSCRIPGPL